MGQTVQSVSLKVKGSIGEMSMLVDTMASKQGREDRGSIRDIMVVMKRSSRVWYWLTLEQLTCIKVLSTCTTGMLRFWLSCH